MQPSRVLRAVDGDADGARALEIGPQELLESAHSLRPVELRRPAQPQTPREALARPVDVHDAFRLQPPRLDKIVEPQRALDDENGVLDDDVAKLLKGFFVQT